MSSHSQPFPAISTHIQPFQANLAITCHFQRVHPFQANSSHSSHLQPFLTVSSQLHPFLPFPAISSNSSPFQPFPAISSHYHVRILLAISCHTRIGLPHCSKITHLPSPFSGFSASCCHALTGSYVED